MPIRMERVGHVRPHRLDLLSPKPGQPIFIVLIDEPANFLKGNFHWLGKSKGLAPCLQEECKWCGKYLIRRQYYAPCLHWRPYSSASNPLVDKAKPGTSGIYDGLARWYRAVLRITEALDTLLLADHRWEVLEISRANNKANGRLLWKYIETLPADRRVDCTPFDPMITLRRVWGEMANYGMTDSQNPDDPQPELFDPIATVPENTTADGQLPNPQPVNGNGKHPLLDPNLLDPDEPGIDSRERVRRRFLLQADNSNGNGKQE